MNQNRTVLFVIFTLIFGTLGAASAFAVDTSKVGYVDIAKVFDEFQKTKDNDTTLQKAGKKKEEERDALVHEVRQLKDELVLLSDEAKLKKQELMETKMRELQDFDRRAKQELGTERNKIVREIFKEIDDTIHRVGEKKGLDFVFNERALLYHHAKYDLTLEILNDLNKEYAKKKK
ncbi:MAG: OmpH family outer membrane protein [Candidatus Omnitrophica bacterium]|nr:OmpH family outer membrane protein [Candidatus Omnitrophota bacterium]